MFFFVYIIESLDSKLQGGFFKKKWKNLKQKSCIPKSILEIDKKTICFRAAI